MMVREMKQPSGFTLVELLMAISVISVLSAVGMTSFGNYTTDAKNAATRANLHILRTGVSAVTAAAQLHCGVAGDIWPPVTSLNLNDVTKFAAPDTSALCTTAQITSFQSRQIVGGSSIPLNPWGSMVNGTGNVIYNCTAAPASGTGANPGPMAGACDPSNHLNCATGVVYAHSSASDDGWCYDPTSGRIWPNSENNKGVAGPPSTYESAF
jgi:prepilin-type N-terminal cleavage/methylation domain-containing protein